MVLVLVLLMYCAGSFLWKGEKSMTSTGPRRLESLTATRSSHLDELEEAKDIAQEPKVFHLLPHSHQDLGWLMTEDGYYGIVQNVISGMIDHLESHPEAKFNYADMGFLYMYLRDKPDQLPRLQKLVKEGRVGLINGAFVLNDHAATTFDDMVSNYQYGRKFLFDRFGVQPDTIWAIDQFGLSATATRLAEALGYVGQVVNRIPDKQKNAFKQSGDMYFKWKPGHDSPPVDTFVLFKHYATEGPFNIDAGLYGVNNYQIRSQILNTDFNLHDLVNEYWGNARVFANYVKTSHILLPVGDDFTFSNFGVTYGVVDVILLFTNSNGLTGRLSKTEVRASTASEYFKAVHDDESKQKEPFKTLEAVDFFPLVEYDYEMGNKVAWSGYFTTNPYSKKALRSFGDLYRGLRSMLASVLPLKPDAKDRLTNIFFQTRHSEWIVGGNQHHDTITGTSKADVAFHYLNRQKSEIERTEPFWKTLIEELVEAKLLSEAKVPAPEEKPAKELSATVGNQMPNSMDNMMVYVNAMLKQQVEAMQRLLHTDIQTPAGFAHAEAAEPVDDSQPTWTIKLISPLSSQIHISAASSYLLQNQASAGKRLLRLKSASNLGALEVTRANGSVESVPLTKVFHSGSSDQSPVDDSKLVTEYRALVQLNNFERVLAKPVIAAPTATENKDLFGIAQGSIPGLDFQYNSNGSLGISRKADGFSLMIGIHQYELDQSKQGNYGKFYSYNNRGIQDSDTGHHAPGKYIFSTTSQEFAPLLVPSSATYRTLNENTGALFTLVYSNFGCSAQIEVDLKAPAADQLTVRLACDGNRRSNIYDLVARYSTLVKNGNTYFTDSNGLYAMERERGKYGPFIECNYYPLTRFAYLEDEENRFSVLVDRGEGSTSPAEGAIEVMFQRESYMDDSRGVAELNFESIAFVAIHRLIFESRKNDQQLFRQAQIQDENPVVVVELASIHNFEFSLKNPISSYPKIPDLVKVSLDTDEVGSTFIRLMNLSEDDDRAVDIFAILNAMFGNREYQLKPVKFDLSELNASAKDELSSSSRSTMNGIKLKPLQFVAYKVVMN